MFRPPTSFFVAVFLPIIFALFRRYVPRDPEIESVEDDGRSLPYGAAGACMWALGIVIAIGGFFALRELNHLFASFDGAPTIVVLPSKFIWMFAPGFASLCLPWLMTLWLLRRSGYKSQANEIVVEGNQKMGWNGEKLMRWLAWCVVAPIAGFTMLALPMHLAVFADSVHVTHYGHLKPEVFNFADATNAYEIDGYSLRDGTFQSHPDLLLDFADGRRLSANAIGDGDTVPSKELVQTFLERSHLHAIHVRSEADIHSSRPDERSGS